MLLCSESHWVFFLWFDLFIWGCAEALLLLSGFLSAWALSLCLALLRRAEAALPAVQGLLSAGRLLLQSVCSRHTGFSSYGTWAQLLWFTCLVTLQWHVGSSWTRNWTHVPYIGRWTLLHSTTREVLSHCILYPLPNTLSVRMVFLTVCSSLLFLISV